MLSTCCFKNRHVKLNNINKLEYLTDMFFPFYSFFLLIFSYLLLLFLLIYIINYRKEYLFCFGITHKLQLLDARSRDRFAHPLLCASRGQCRRTGTVVRDKPRWGLARRAFCSLGISKAQICLGN